MTAKSGKLTKLQMLLAVLAIIASPFVAVVLLYNAFSLIGAQSKKSFVKDIEVYASESDHIFLERFGSGRHVIDSVEIRADGFLNWLHSLPKGVGLLRRSSTKCWMPHHQIRFVASGGAKFEREAAFVICFRCDELESDGAGRSHIPFAWRKPLRDLFGSVSISEHAPTRAEEDAREEEMLRNPAN